MKKDGMRACLRIVVSIAIVLFIFEGLANAQQRYSLSKYFPLSEGATWTYLRIKTTPPNDIEVNCIAKINDPSFGWIYRRFLFDSGEQVPSYSYNDMNWSKSGLEVYRSGNNNLSAVSGGYTIYDPPLVRFPASMTIGETFTQTGIATEYDLNGIQQSQYSFSWTITLVGVENLQVYIGTVTNCLKFDVTLSAGSENEQWTLWLASGIGEVKSVEPGQVGQLLSFTKGGMTYYPIPPTP